MDIVNVFALIIKEREYQKSRNEIVNATPPFIDENHSIADWILYMEAHIATAKSHLYSFHAKKALSEIRKATALGVACMEFNETPARKTWTGFNKDV